MFVILAVFLIAILIVVVPAIAASVARNVATNIDRRPPGSIDQSLVEARLGRIEEAIDAMAVQIERLSEHQRSLLGPDPDASRDEESSRLRTEN